MPETYDRIPETKSKFDGESERKKKYAKLGAKIFLNVFRNVRGIADADHVLGRPGQALFHFVEFLRGRVANRAFRRRIVALMHVTAYRTHILSHNDHSF